MVFRQARPWLALIVAAMLPAGKALGQAKPPAPPNTPDLPCSTNPDGADTVVTKMGCEGFLSLFDGTTFKGWGQSCQTAHGGPAIFRVDPVNHAIYSTQKGTTGGLM